MYSRSALFLAPLFLAAFSPLVLLPLSSDGALDVNGDGHPDLLISQPLEFAPAYAYHGNGSLLSSTPDGTIPYPSSPHFFGSGVNLGDVDGDGFSDVALGMPYDGGTRGMVFLYRGSATGLSASPAVVLPSPQPVTRPGSGFAFGTSLSGALDVDGDGCTDLVVGSQGRVYLFRRTPAGLDPSPLSSLEYPPQPDGTDLENTFGGIVRMGDFNGDGYGDLVVGAGLSHSLVGRAFVYLGGPGGFTLAPDVLSPPAAPGRHYFGLAISEGEDLNGDGFDDLAIGAPAAFNWQGRVHVYYGSPAGLPLVPSLTLSSPAGVLYGRALSAIGDFTGDGLPDLAITDRDSNQVHIHAGGPAGLGISPIATLTGPGVVAIFGDTHGLRMTGIGDLDGDHRNEIAVSQLHFHVDGLPRGVVYIFRGGATGNVLVPDQIISAPPPTDPRLGIYNSHFGAAMVGYNPHVLASRPACNRPPTAVAGADRVVAATGILTQVALDASDSSDPDGHTLAYEWSGAFGTVSGVAPTVFLPLGLHEITLTVSDPFGSASTDIVQILVRDETPPAIQSATADPAVLWPPDHRMVPILLTLSVSDTSGAAPVNRILSVTSNEPVDSTGDGAFAPDWILGEGLSLQLRAERNGQGSGRVYIVTVSSTDAAGNTATASIPVLVPKSRK